MKFAFKIIFTILIITGITVLVFSVTIFKNPAQGTKNIKMSDRTDVNNGYFNLPDNVVIGAWLWQSPTQVSRNTSTILDICQKNHINTVYIALDEYIDIYEMKSSPEKDQKLTEFKNSLSKLISEASSKGISVAGVAGNTNWAYDTHNYIPPILLDFVFKYNAEVPQESRLKGLQFDIEFYNDINFFNDNVYSTDGFLTLVKNLVEQTNSLSSQTREHIELGFTIPYWFDRKNNYIPRSIIDDIYSSLSQIPDSYVVVMAYSKDVGGQEGTLAISKKELELTKDYSVKVIIGQDIKQNKYVNITHFGQTKAQIGKDLLEIIEQSKIYPGFIGISINDLQGIADLK